jgi:uncharacterized protein (DUF302 family)
MMTFRQQGKQLPGCLRQTKEIGVRRTLLTAMTACALGLTAWMGGSARAQAPQQAVQPDASAGLVSRRSSHTVAGTIQRFEAAVRDNGYMVFTEIDHAAAAQKAGLSLRPRTVVVFGNPKIGTPAMQRAATLAIDVPLRALVWEDDAGAVWLTYTTGEYLARVVYPRHGLSMTEASGGIERTLEGMVRRATE